MICRKKHKTVKILDWESFEAYLLALPVFNEVYDVDDTRCQFNSVELLCESRLRELINYKKTSLTKCLKKDFCKNALIVLVNTGILKVKIYYFIGNWIVC